MTEPEDTRAEVELDPRFIGVVDLIGRCGASTFELRWSDDQAPVVWMAIAGHRVDPHGRFLRGDGGVGRTVYQVHAALHPLPAVIGLGESLMDGGQCVHCGRPTGLDTNLTAEPMPLPRLICWYQWDPELATFRRSCEGDSPPVSGDADDDRTGGTSPRTIQPRPRSRRRRA